MESFGKVTSMEASVEASVGVNGSFRGSYQSFRGRYFCERFCASLRERYFHASLMKAFEKVTPVDVFVGAFVQVSPTKLS